VNETAPRRRWVLATRLTSLGDSTTHTLHAGERSPWLMPHADARDTLTDTGRAAARKREVRSSSGRTRARTHTHENTDHVETPPHGAWWRRDRRGRAAAAGRPQWRLAHSAARCERASVPTGTVRSHTQDLELLVEADGDPVWLSFGPLQLIDLRLGVVGEDRIGDRLLLQAGQVPDERLVVVA